MAKNDQPNPIYDRLARSAHGPSKGLVRWLSIGTGAAALLTAIMIFVFAPTLISLVLLATGAVVAISPAVMALYAANLTANDLRQENRQMLELAGITENTMLYGYANAAAHRMRLLIAIAAALTPAMVLSGGFTMIGAMSRAGFSLSPLATLGVLLILSPLMAVTTVGMWIFQKIGGTLGAFLAVWWKRPLPAMAASSLAMLLVMPMVFYATFWFLTFLSMIIVPLLSKVL